MHIRKHIFCTALFLVLLFSRLLRAALFCSNLKVLIHRVSKRMSTKRGTLLSRLFQKPRFSRH